MNDREKLNSDLTELLNRKESTYQSYHQILGAISILEQMIYRIDNPDWDKNIKSEDKLEDASVGHSEPIE